VRGKRGRVKEGGEPVERVVLTALGVIKKKKWVKRKRRAGIKNPPQTGKKNKWEKEKKSKRIP